MERHWFRYLSVLIISVSIPCNAQQIVKWNLVTDGSPTPVSSNCSSGWLTPGSGITISPVSGEWANANSWPATSVDTSKYYQVFLAPHKGYKLTITALHFSERRSLTGIRTFQVRWSKSASFTQYDTFPAVTVPDDDAVRAHILDNLNLAASQNDTLFIRWYGYNVESRTGTWRISANSLSIDGNVNSTIPKDADSQIIQPSAEQIGSSVISSLADTQQLAQPVFRFSIRDAGTSDTLPTRVTRITLKPGKGNTADWPKNIQGLKIVAEDTIQTANVAVSSGQILIPVPSGKLVIPNGQSRDITILVYLNKSGLEDGKVLQFQVDSVNHGFETSDTASAFSQSFPQNLVSGTFPIDVKATRMVFSSIPLSVIENIDFPVSIHLCDVNGNTDIHSGRQVIIEKYAGNGILSSIDSLTRHAVSGECTWNHLKYKGSGPLVIKILTAGLKDSILMTNDISVIDPPASISDDFENGKLSEWLNTDEWECSDVEPIDGKLSLKHSASVDPLATKDTSYISRKLPLWNWGNLPFCWRITLKNGNFDPSSDNKFGFFLVSDNPDLAGKQLTGYVVGVNLSGTTDKLTLWKMEKGHIVSALINANFDWNASDTVALEVTRSSQGLWALKYNMSGDFQKLLTAGSMSDTSFKSNGYCGLLYTFTPSRAGQLWADDFYAGLPVLDTIPPKLIELKVLNNTTLQLRFSEYISNQSAVNTGNYLINGSIQPAVVKQDTADASLILLCFEKPFEKNLAHTLNISHLSDQNGNIIKDPANQMFSYCPFEALEARPLSENHLVVCFSQVPDTKNVLLKSCYLLKETG
ncbi:MAG: hypothetical protein Q8910_11280, partial [Bacteroidota bacterium]|nr:hypothetical protein [Bacteroidota bacterium]